MSMRKVLEWGGVAVGVVLALGGALRRGRSPGATERTQESAPAGTA
jgi:hypothetical protein